MAGKLTKKDRETRERFRIEREARESCEARLMALKDEDNFAGGIDHLWKYPEFENRELSTFEGDLRDWGFVYGLAFGTILADRPDMPHSQAAQVASIVALKIFVDWSGWIENPVEKREEALRSLVRRYADAERRCDNGNDDWPTELRGAVEDVVEWARG